jgi:hypothetical protein
MNQMSYQTRITQMTITPEGEPIFSERATQISIDDEADGEYIVIKQPTRSGDGISIAPEEWPIVRAAIDNMFAEIAEYEKSISPKL